MQKDYWKWRAFLRACVARFVTMLLAPLSALATAPASAQTPQFASASRVAAAPSRGVTYRTVKIDHFALEERGDEIAAYIRSFLPKYVGPERKPRASASVPSKGR